MLVGAFKPTSAVSYLQPLRVLWKAVRAVLLEGRCRFAAHKNIILYTRTIHKYIGVGPLGYFIHIPITTPVVSALNLKTIIIPAAF